MKIQFVSDLHLEFADNRAYLKEHPLEVTGDILLLAGDSVYLDLPESGRDTYSQYERNPRPGASDPLNPTPVPDIPSGEAPQLRRFSFAFLLFSFDLSV